MCDRVPVDFVHFGANISLADLPGSARADPWCCGRTLGSFGSILRSGGPLVGWGPEIILPGRKCSVVVELPRGLSPGRCASSVDSASQVAPTTCPVALAQLQVCVPVGVVLGAGLGRADQGNDLSLGYRTGQG